MPETTDIYDAKNMPKVIYCIHGLSWYLYKLGRAPPMQDLSGKAKFTNDEISAMLSTLARYSKTKKFASYGHKYLILRYLTQNIPYASCQLCIYTITKF